MKSVQAVVDTNVVLDIYSITDLSRAHESGGDDDTPERLFRRVRLRESLMLAWLFHVTHAVTVSLPNELQRLAARHAPPDAKGTVELQHMQLSIYLQKDLVLSNWVALMENVDEGLVGSKADAALLDLCRKYRAPLITNEGYSVAGVSDSHGLRAKAISAGIRVFTPRQYWSGKIGETSTRKFLARYDAVSKRFVRRQNSTSAVKDAVSLRRAILQHVFFGHTKGATLPVRLPDSS